MTSSLLYLLFFLSGAAGLGYEIVWTRMFAVGLGHEIVSLLAVVSAFFAGFAVGAWALDKRVSSSRTPGRWYAGLEIGIGLWAIATTVLIPWMNETVASLIGPEPSALRHWSFAFLVPVITLFPATAAMGATLPAMDRLFSRLRHEGRSIGGIYGVNTLGAVAGTLASTVVIIPVLGFRATALSLALVNIFVGIVVLLGFSRHEETRQPIHQPIGEIGARRLGLTVFATGTLGIGYEVLGVRVMSQVLENTVYSFAAALAVYLFGTALGATVYQRFIVGRFGPQSDDTIARRTLSRLVIATSIACLFGVQVLSRADAIYATARQQFGGGFTGSVGAELVVGFTVFFLPSCLVGATFSHLAQSARQTAGGVGRALGLNTAGATLAPFVFGVLLLPAVGSKTSLIVVALGYLLLIPRLKPRPLLVAAVPIAALLSVPTNLMLVKPAPGGEVLVSDEGTMAVVSVVTDQQDNRFLKVNDRFYMGGTNAAFPQWRQAHIPLALHRSPESVLFLGIGTGITMGAAAAHANLQTDGAELVPEVIDVLPYFGEFNADLAARDDMRLMVADARRYVRSADRQYDVIVGDLFHPGRDGAGSLYTVEHFVTVRDRLSSGGLFCQWLPLYQLNTDVLKIIVRSYLEAFPDAVAFLAHFNAESPTLGLVGSQERLRYDADWMERRFPEPFRAERLREVDLANTMSLLGSFVAGTDDLTAFAGDGPLNTDDLPLVTFMAPDFIYTADPRTYSTLLELTDAITPRAADILRDADAASQFATRLDRYLAARQIYLVADVERVEGRYRFAIEGYLASARESPDFGPARDMTMALARSIAATDPDQAREILSRLQAANSAP